MPFRLILLDWAYKEVVESAELTAEQGEFLRATAKLAEDRDELSPHPLSARIETCP
jgi:hypothetical protein